MYIGCVSVAPRIGPEICPPLALVPIGGPQQLCRLCVILSRRSLSFCVLSFSFYEVGSFSFTLCCERFYMVLVRALNRPAMDSTLGFPLCAAGLWLELSLRAVVCVCGLHCVSLLT